MPKQASVAEEMMDELRAFLKRAPWWAGLVAIVVGYLVFYFVLPFVLGFFSSETDANKPLDIPEMIGNICRIGAPFVAGVVGLVWIIALFDKFTDHQRLQSQRGIETIRELSWREFEQLLATAYERQGYHVTDTGLNQCHAKPDGGIDLILERNGQRILVQCKQWKSRKVGVKIARELYGLVASEHADGGILVTSGSFTQPTQDFAEKLPLNLIDGPKLQVLIDSVQQSQKTAREQTRRPRSTALKVPNTSTIENTATPTCPKCERPMIERTVKRGPKSGQTFWGCSGFPKCRGTRAI